MIEVVRADIGNGIAATSALVALAALLISQRADTARRISNRVAHRNLAYFAFRFVEDVAQNITEGKFQTRAASDWSSTKFGLDAIDTTAVTPTSWLNDLLQVRLLWDTAEMIDQRRNPGNDLAVLDNARTRAREAIGNMDRKLKADGIQIDRDNVAIDPDFWRCIRATRNWFSRMRRGKIA